MWIPLIVSIALAQSPDPTCDATLVPSEGLVLAADQRLSPGESFALRAYNAVPGERVVFARSGRSDLTVCPAALKGACLDLPSPKVVGTAIADDDGVAELVLTVRDEAASTRVSFQAGVATCDGALTNVVERQVLGDGACAFTPAQWTGDCAQGRELGCVRDDWFSRLYPTGFVAAGVAYPDSATVAQQLGTAPEFEAQLVALKLNLDFDAGGVFGPRDALASEQVLSGAFAGQDAATLLAVAASTPAGSASSDLVEAMTFINEGYAQCDPAVFLAPGESSCGNGVLEPAEEGDDGNDRDHDGCGATCELEFCGDGVLQCGEECDDGNNVDGDGCAARCYVEGDAGGQSICDPVIGDGPGPDPDPDPDPETGDTGPDDTGPSDTGGEDTSASDTGLGDTGPGDTGPGDTGLEPTGGIDTGPHDSPSEDTVETARDTGTVIIDPATGDTGSPVDTDGFPTGDTGFDSAWDTGLPVDTGLPIDTAWRDDSSVHDSGTDDTGASASTCGDGVLDEGEVCDDGNTASDDGCSAFCRLEFCDAGTDAFAAADDTPDDLVLVVDDAEDGDGQDYVVEGALPGDVILLLEAEGYAPQTCPWMAFDACTDVVDPEVVAVIEADQHGKGRTHVEQQGNNGTTLSYTYVQAVTVANGGPHKTDVLATHPVHQAGLPTRVHACPEVRCGGDGPDPTILPEPTCTDAEDASTPVTLDAVVEDGEDEGTVVVTVRDATPGEPVLFLVGPRRDSGPCPTKEAGLYVGQKESEPVGLVIADEDGEASIELPAVPADSDETVVALVPTGDGGERSETVSLVVQPCGNGTLEPELGETCDDGNRASDDGCSWECLVESCGDGIRQKPAGEQCDDGNLVDGDGCSAECLHERCGDGLKQETEECDDGGRLAGDGCSPVCDIEYCGDGAVAPWEECDDGNADGNDGCSELCVLEFCGDGIKQTGLGETCDDGNLEDFDGCRGDCIREKCGDGILQPSEACEDGNLESEDGCSAMCLEEFCGDDVRQRGLGETCDDGNHVDDDGCRADCIKERCGDGIVQSSEECDDGARVPNDGCSAYCLVEFCGDDLVQDGEECDDGNNDDDDGCTSTCVLEFCGDGVLQTGEECDDGNADDDDGCASTCLVEFCGDGIQQAGEACDGGPGCSETCEQIIVDVVAGGDHSCSVDIYQQPYCWGDDRSGQSSPPDDAAFRSVTAGLFHTCGLDGLGVATCWGRDTYGQVQAPATAFVQLALGGYHSCGITAAGQLECWGRDDFGQASPPPGTYAHVDADSLHTCAVTTSGEMVCFGRDSFGQASPPAGTDFVMAAAGTNHSCGLHLDGSTECWGSNLHGRATPPGDVFVAIGSGYVHSCGLTAGGTVTCWGSDTNDQLQVPSAWFRTLSVGNKHSCGMTIDGDVACWGDDSDGQCEPFPED